LLAGFSVVFGRVWLFGCSAVVAATRLHKAHLTSALAHCPVFSELGVGLSIGN